MRLFGVFLAVVAIPFAWLCWLWVVHPVVLRRRDQRRTAARQRATTGELLIDAKDAVRSEGWQRFKSGERILSLEQSCAESDFYLALKTLWAEACDEDHQKGRSGRDSNFFELHDCGMAALTEELERRAGGARHFSSNEPR
jgi:hypothetical protein